MKQLKNNKGMSLVEVVMAILIISIASVLLVQSLSTVTKVIGKADRRSYITNEQLTTLVGSQASDQVTVTEAEKEVTITAEGLSKPIKIQGTYQEASSKDGTEVTLRNFSATEKREDIYQNMLSNTKEMYDKINTMSRPQLEQYLKELENEAGISTGLTIPSQGYTNDHFRVFYYLKYGFPSVKQEVIDECNMIFDQGHQGVPPTTNVGKMKFGDRKMYWKVYYLYNTKTSGEFILYGSFTNDLSTDGWATSLVYNQEDESLYYKIFSSKDSYTTTGATISLTKYGSSSNGLFNLQTELSDTTQWVKLKNK